MRGMRIGHGFDVHAFAAERPLIIGGVNIAWHLGLAGHSDADVLLHAICDALLGAAGLGDIGKHFPDNDAKYHNIDSRKLLRLVRDKITLAGYEVINIDCTIIAQMPRMAPHIPMMQQNITEDLSIAQALINVKATTTEQLGFTGRGEGIAAEAVCLLMAKGD